jgi:hypothetical protein
MRRCDWPANRARGRASPCAAGGEGTVPQELERMLKLGPYGEPSSLGTSRYLVGCPMCTVPNKRGKVSTCPRCGRSKDYLIGSQKQPSRRAGTKIGKETDLEST